MNDKQLLPFGSVIGHYRVVRHIASGGFGNTYEVEHVSLPLRRCIKEFFMRGINQRVGDAVTVSVEDNRTIFEQMREKFLKEAQRMAQFRNAHVVPVTDFFEQNGTAYYVMELIEGQSLADTMKAQGRPFTEAEVVKMLPQLLDALLSIHAKGIYHLDLKPANIMCDGDGNLRLIDFGASKQLTQGESQTLSTATGHCYTPRYAPTELVNGSADYIGPWTDLYSLGATLYNLLTNQAPPDVVDVAQKHEHAFAFPAGISDGMRTLIVSLMQPDISKRPHNVADIELPPANQDDTTTVVRGNGGAKIKKTRLSWWKYVVAGGLALLLALLLILMPKGCGKKVMDESLLSCPDDNHPHSIDLGLPSGTKWACCNVGAKAPEEDGGYFAWGETHKKRDYNSDSYQWYGSGTGYVKLGTDIAGTSYDAASAVLGYLWRMPTVEQCEELIKCCSSEWTIQDGRQGIRFTGHNGGSIFIPAAGFRKDSVCHSREENGFIWSSTPNYPHYAWGLYLKKEGVNIRMDGRYLGRSVRAVCQEK